MLDPYRMIFINKIASAFIVSGIIFYTYVYPKKRINLFLLLILISILPIISIFRDGAYESGDFNIHIYRTMAFYDSLREGNIMPSWAKDLNATYGYPLFIFNYPLPYYILSFIHFLGFGFIASMKLFLAFNIILSGIFMYLFSRNLFKNSLAAFSSSIFYIFTPYHLIDIHFKVAIGEILAFTILPLIFFFIQKFYIKRDFIFLLWAGTSLALIIMAHALIAFFAVGMVLMYIIFLTSKNNFKDLLFYCAWIFIIPATISLYVWLAPFIFNPYLYIQKVPMTTVYFPQIFELLYSPWRGGFLFQGPVGQISFLIGYTQVFIVVISLILFISKKIPKKYLNDQRFWLIISFVILFLITPYSKFLWEHFSFVKAAGSHRLLLLLIFCISILAGYFILIFVKRKVLLHMLIIATIGYTILNWGHRRVIPEINDNILKANLWKSTSEGEGHFYANSKWVNIKHPWFSERPKKNLEILKGEGGIKHLKRTSTKHTYLLSAKTPLSLVENTLYFPGWEAKSNNNILSLSPNSSGVITLNVPKGRQILTLTYNDLPLYKLSKIISFAGGLAILVYTLYCCYEKKRNHTFRR